MKIVYLFFFLIGIITASKDYYQILQIDRDASEKEIKSSYRQLSRKYHPDKNSSPEANEKFIEIGEAYEILSNPEKRSNYDQFGDPNARSGQHVDFGDIFNQFFGGQKEGHHGHRGTPRGDDTVANLHISLADFYRGKELGFDVEMLNICDHCEGTGSSNKQKHICPKCGGIGVIQIKRQFGPGMIQTFTSPCDECAGKGQYVKHKCSKCNGKGVKPTSRHYDVHVSPGFKRNNNIVLKGEGDQNPDWVPGDLILNLREDLKESWGYRRIGNNLYRTEPITLNESLNGNWERKIPFFDIDDDILYLKRDKGVIVSDGEVEILGGKGMPIIDDDGAYGDLYIEYKVITQSGIKMFIRNEL